MNPDDMISLTLEGSLSLLVFVIAYKIYKMKLKVHSGCCLKKDGAGNGVVFDSQNSGVSSENDVLDKL